MPAVFDVFTSPISFYSYICNYTVYFPYPLNPSSSVQTHLNRNKSVLQYNRISFLFVCLCFSLMQHDLKAKVAEGRVSHTWTHTQRLSSDAEHTLHRSRSACLPLHSCLPTLTLRWALGGRGVSCKRADNAVYIVFKWDDITLGHRAWQPSVAEKSSFP